jgi:hypothetical protein
MSETEATDSSKSKRDKLVLLGTILVLAFLVFHYVTTNSSSNNSESENASSSQTLSTCEIAMQRASLEPDSTIAESFLKATAYSCAGGSEWNAALRKYPAAMGFDTVSGDELEIICFNYRDSPTCVNP